MWDKFMLANPIRSNPQISYKGITANFYYDDRDPQNAGWYAEYYDRDRIIDDSMKVSHEEMPKRRNAEKKAESVVRRHLRELADKGELRINPRRRWHWVEDDNHVVLFVGSHADATRYYKQHGGSRSGLHLMNADAETWGARPKVGEIIA